MDNLGITDLKVSQLEPHPNNPRKNLGDLEELTRSIRKNGVLQNLTVVPLDDSYDKFRVVIGHRRLAAAQAAGVFTLPCRIIEGMDEKTQFSTMMEENLQRNDLTVWEQAEGFQMMLDFGDSIDAIVSKTGFSESTVRHRLKIAELPEDVVKKMTEDEESGFQMTLTDFYRLEQVAEIDERLKILSRCSSRANLEYELNQYQRNKTIDSRRRAIEGELRELGLRTAPQEAENGRWNGTWIQLDSYQLQFEEEPKVDSELLLCAHKPEELFYYENYSTIYVVAKNPDAAKERERKKEQDNDYKAREMAMGQLREIVRSEDLRRQAFIKDIAEGKVLYNAQTDITAWKSLIFTLMQFVINANIRIERKGALEVLAGKKGRWDLERDERTAAKEVLDNAKADVQLLLMVEGRAKNAADCASWNAVYDDVNGESVAEYYGILERHFGYNCDHTSDVWKVIDGSHPLYREEEDDLDDEWDEEEEE